MDSAEFGAGASFNIQSMMAAFAVSAGEGFQNHHLRPQQFKVLPGNQARSLL